MPRYRTVARRLPLAVCSAALAGLSTFSLEQRGHSVWRRWSA